MEQEEQLSPTTRVSEMTYHGFWPVLLIGVSLLVIFAWEITVNMSTRQSARELQEQNMRLVDKANQVRTGLEKLTRGLVDLAKTDDEAKKLVAKFGIKVTEPTVPTSAPAP